jgi:catechol 2,3-dioxygenase-like lactoylglutathione lyase family enzyme
MLKTITHVNVWVRDQDEALEFYTTKLGLEVRQDVTLEEMGGSLADRQAPASRTCR